MSERVGAEVVVPVPIIVVDRVRRAADAEAVENADDRTGHYALSLGSMRSGMSGYPGALSPSA